MDEKIFDAPVLQDAPSDFSRASATRHSEQSRPRRSSSDVRRTSRRLVLAIALSVSLVVLFFVIIFSVVRITDLARQNDALQAKLDKNQLELSQTRPELERTRKMIEEMAKGRLPNLHDLMLDKVININGTYLKNIVFAVLNNNGTKSYEYKLVMENSTSRTIHPEARILVFDRYGIQIGSNDVAGRGELTPGESRSQSSRIDRFIDEEPRYFYVSTMPSDLPVKPIK